MTDRQSRPIVRTAVILLLLVAAPIGAAGTAAPSNEGVETQNADLDECIESVDENEIANANEAIASFNGQLQESARLPGKRSRSTRRTAARPSPSRYPTRTAPNNRPRREQLGISLDRLVRDEFDDD